MIQRYHVVFEGGNITTRRPWKGPKVERYSSSGCIKDGVVIPAMFGGHEVRQFLEVLGEFSIVTIDAGKSENGTKLARQILDEGLIIEDPDTQVKSNWYVAGYFVRDEGVVYVMSPNPMNDDQFFNALMLHVDLENEWSNSFKVGKYLKRLYSHHRMYLEGTVISSTDSVVMVRMPSGRIWSVRYAKCKIADGMNLVSPSVMRELKLKRDVGQGLRITALSPKGFSKGHAIVKDGLMHDLVLFNSKTLLKSKGDKFVFGVLEFLHDSSVFTDAQSTVNFRLNRVKYEDGERCVNRWFQTFGEQVLDACEDQEKLRKMLRFYTSEFHKYEEGEEKGDYIEKEKDWAILRALRGGLHYQQYPGLLRKIYRLFTEKVMDCEFRVRVPVPTEVGGARYALVDPTIFDANGDPTLEGELRGNTIYVEGHVGEVAFHRQPNGHRGEHHVAMAVNNSTLSGMDKGCFIFMSRDMVTETMDKLGGGDQDDRLVYYKDQTIVDHFKQLEPYPSVAAPMEKKVVLPTNKYANAFIHRLHRTPVYDRAQLLVMLDQQKKSGITIGQVVNPLIIDTCISDDLEMIIETMPKYLPMEIPKHRAAYEYAKAYQKNTLRMSANSLEAVIDAQKKDGRDSLTPAISKEVKAYNDTFMLVPEFCTRGKKWGGRVPASRRTSNAPIPVVTDIDEMLSEIQDMRVALENTINRISWQNLEPIPLEIITFPAREAGVNVAHAIRAYYHQMREKFNADIPPTADLAETKARISAYVKIDNAVYQEYYDHPLIIDAMVYLYQMIYEARRPDAPMDELTGKYQQFPDGLLWGPRISGLTMKMLEKVGLSGRYAEVDFDPDFKHMRHDYVDANINDGVVTVPGVVKPVGLVDPLADGFAKPVEKGYVKVPAAYEPVTRIKAMTVVNGWKQKGMVISDTEVQEWLSHVHEKVNLVPYIYDNNGDDEHAVHIMLGERVFGNLSREDAPYITMPTKGVLAPGKTPRTLEVLIAR